MLECFYFWYRYEKNEELVKKKQLGKDALLNYMMSDENAPVILDRLDIYQVHYINSLPIIFRIKPQL